MKKQKIYLSKSKAGSIVNISSLTYILEQYGYEVLSFEGGNYTTGKLSKADILLIVPPNKPVGASNDSTYTYTIGKGQCTEFGYFTEHNKGTVWVISGIIGNTIYGAKIVSIDMLCEDWTTKYASLTISLSESILTSEIIEDLSLDYPLLSVDSFICSNPRKFLLSIKTLLK